MIARIKFFLTSSILARTMTALLAIAGVVGTFWGSWAESDQAKVATSSVPVAANRSHDVVFGLWKERQSTFVLYILNNRDGIAAKDVCLTFMGKEVIAYCDVPFRESESPGGLRCLLIDKIPPHSTVSVWLEQPEFVDVLNAFPRALRVYDDCGEFTLRYCQDSVQGEIIGEFLRAWQVEHRNRAMNNNAQHGVALKRMLLPSPE